MQLGRTSNSDRGDLSDCGVLVRLGVTEISPEGGFETNAGEELSDTGLMDEELVAPGEMEVGPDTELIDGGLVAGVDGGLTV